MTNKTEYMRKYMREYLRSHPEARDAARKRARKHSRSKLPSPTRPAPTACEMCGKNFEASACLDHCHTTNSFRGWLCSNCNLGIGLLGDTLQGVLNAVKYLQRNSGKTHYEGDGCVTHS